MNFGSAFWVIILSSILVGSLILNYTISWREFKSIKVGDCIWVYNYGGRAKHIVTFAGNGIIKLNDGYTYTLKDYMNGSITRYLHREYM